MKLNNRDKLVTWFCENYWQWVQAMKATNHFPEHRTDHPFHGEGSVWTHTMMVMTNIDCDENIEEEIINENKQILLTVALLHDIGKPLSRQVKEQGEKFSFEGHEGISYYKAIDILKSMEKVDDFYTNDRIFLILKLISVHGTHILFEENSRDWYLSNRFRKADKRGAVRNVDENIFAQYPKKKVSSRKHTLEDKELIICVGLPGSGKTTYIEENLKDYFVISRDKFMIEYYDSFTTNNSELVTGNTIYDFINHEDNIESFNKLFDNFINVVSKREDKVVIDMTMLTFGKRRSMLNKFSKHNANCVVFISGEKEINRVNRERETFDAGLTDSRLLTLKKKFIFPIEEEGFNDVRLRFR